MLVFCAFQERATRADILKAYDNPNSLQDKIEELCDFMQTPTVYDSHGAANGDELPVCESFHFFNDANFLTFCLKYLAISSLKEARGIPDHELPSFFDSFTNGPLPTIHCFKLKRHSSGKPLAFFLMKWDEQFYHIHLHFNDFDEMKLTGVSHVNVTKGWYYYKGYYYRFAEKDDTKVPINYNPDDRKWKLVEGNKVNMINHCKAFVRQNNKR